MGPYIAKRCLTLAATLVFASLIVFWVMDILPGNAAQLLLGPDATPDTIAALTRKLGLDRPAPERYASWIGGMLRGDFGVSSAYDTPVAQLIGERLQVSLPLALIAMALAMMIAISAGVAAAAGHRTGVDTTIMAGAQIGLALPSFWLAILLVLVFAVHLHWLPAGGFPGWGGGIWPGLRALLLPALSLAVVQGAILARVTRSSMLEAMGEDFARTARAKGLSRSQTLRRHVLRHALGAVLTMAGLQFSSLIASAVVIENVFSLPGLGRLIFQAISNRDAVVVRDCVLVLATLIVGVNFCIDLAVVVVDPRLRARAI